MSTGNTGKSLHAKTGLKRTVLVPDASFANVRQALGRMHRNPLRRIVVETLEELVAAVIQKKIDALDPDSNDDTLLEP